MLILIYIKNRKGHGMAKLYFKYGAMGSSKTANALITKFNYEERGMKVLLIKPATDDRDGVKTVRSRIGLAEDAIVIRRETDIYELFLTYDDHHVIIADECQFFTEKQIDELRRIVDEFDVPVLCFGLRTDFQENFFEGSMWLMAWADTIEEVKTICWCGRKAICNARVVDGVVVKEGDQILLGGSSQYVSLCRKHFHSGQLEE